MRLRTAFAGVARGWLALAIVVLATVAIAVNTSAVAPDAAPAASVTAARFALVVDGLEIASFTELQGLGAVTSVASPRGTDEASSFVPGRPQAILVTLRRRANDDPTMWAWHEAVRLGKDSALKSVTLVAYDVSGRPVGRWLLANTILSGLTFEKTGSTVALRETVVLAAQAVTRQSP